MDIQAVCPNKRYTAYKKGKFNAMAKKIIKKNSCPYCGGQAELMTKTVDFCNNTIINFYVECLECKAATEQYNTHFGTLCSDGRMRKMTEREAVLRAINDWNSQNFNIQTRLLHMTCTEKTMWYIEKLLSMAWYGAMVPLDSPEYIRGWQLRKVAEDMELLKLYSGINYDLSEVARKMFVDARVKDIISQYFEEKQIQV